jgi:membrane peptidoglycan carboxypeptidase
MERARQLLAARRENSGTLPAISSEMLRSGRERKNGSETGAAPNGKPPRERRRAVAARVLGQPDRPPAEGANRHHKHDGQAGEPVLASEPPGEGETLAALAAAASATPLPEADAPQKAAEEPARPEVQATRHVAHEDQHLAPVSASDAPGSARLANGTPRLNGGGSGWPGKGAAVTRPLVAVRTRRLPETNGEREGVRSAGDAGDDKEDRLEDLALVALRPRTEPLAVVEINRMALLNEEARRERTLRTRRDAAKRWRRRRRFALYLMEQQRRRQRRHDSRLRGLVTSSVILFALMILVVIGYAVGDAYIYYQSQAALLGNLQGITSRDNVQIFDSTGKLIYTITADGVKHYIPLSKMSINAINATIATEDKDFWTNEGVDFTAILRAAAADFNSGGIVQGGSSITQQLIKNNVTGSDDTFDRKLREAILAVGATQQYTKEQILEMYLNSIGYGENAYGIDAAALEYFNLADHGNVTGASQLDLAQASMLAGLPKNPNQFDPFQHPKAALDRQKEVLLAMVQDGYINDAEAAQAEQEAAAPNFLHAPPPTSNLAPHFVSWIEDQLGNMIDSGKINFSLSGLRVYTTLNLDLQNKVQQILDNQINALSGSHVDNGAAVMIDQHTGAVLVMLGSADYYNEAIDGKFNVATLGLRQVGSSFKPITYVTAFEKGWFPAMTVYNGPTAFPNTDTYNYPEGYKPLNYFANQFGNEVTLRYALQNSLNVPAVKVLEFAGIDDTLNMAERLGITITPASGTPGLSMTLGSLDIHLLDFTSAYSTFANYGVRNPPFGIWRITDQTGKTLYQYTPAGEQVISPQLAYMITSVLSDNRSRQDDFGFCNPLYLETYADCRAGQQARPAAAKTGTTQDFRDDLTMGYTMDYTMGVWVGNTDDSPTDEKSGIVGAAPVWNASMLAAEEGRPYQDFPVPPGMERDTYCSSGICSTDWFISGSVPQHGGQGNSGSPIPKECLQIKPGAPGGKNWEVQCPPPAEPPGGGNGGGPGPGPGPCTPPRCPPPPPGTPTGATAGPTSQVGPFSVPAPEQPTQKWVPLRDGDIERPGLRN